MQASVLKALGPEMEAWTGDILKTLEAHFRASGSERPALEAAILFATIDGISQHFAMDPDRYPLDAVADALIAKHRARPGKPKPSKPGKDATHGNHEPRNPGRGKNARR